MKQDNTEMVRQSFKEDCEWFRHAFGDSERLVILELLASIPFLYTATFKFKVKDASSADAISELLSNHVH